MNGSRKPRTLNSTPHSGLLLRIPTRATCCVKLGVDGKGPGQGGSVEPPRHTPGWVASGSGCSCPGEPGGSKLQIAARARAARARPPQIIGKPGTPVPGTVVTPRAAPERLQHPVPFPNPRRRSTLGGRRPGRWRCAHCVAGPTGRRAAAHEDAFLECPAAAARDRGEGTRAAPGRGGQATARGR